MTIQRRTLSAARQHRGMTAALVTAAGMADDHARAWLDHAVPAWRTTWPRRGREVLAELRVNGHEHLAERLLEVLGPVRER